MHQLVAASVVQTARCARRGRRRRCRAQRQALHRIALGQPTVGRIAVLQPRRIAAVVGLHLDVRLCVADAAIVQLDGAAMLLMVLVMVMMAQCGGHAMVLVLLLLELVLLLEQMQLGAVAAAQILVVLLGQTVRAAGQTLAQRLIQLGGRRPGQRAAARLRSGRLRSAGRSARSAGRTQIGGARLRAARHFVR